MSGTHCKYTVNKSDTVPRHSNCFVSKASIIVSLVGTGAPSFSLYRAQQLKPICVWYTDAAKHCCWSFWFVLFLLLFCLSFTVLLTQTKCAKELSIHFLSCPVWHWDWWLQRTVGLLFPQRLCGPWRRCCEQSQHSDMCCTSVASSSWKLWTRNLWKLLGSMCFVF